MSEPTLTEALETHAQAPEQRTVFDLIARMQPEIEKALPDLRGGERFARLVTTEIRRTPKLLECSPESLIGAMMLAAQLGLEPGPLGHVYLVPFGKQVEFVIGYKGLIDLAYRSGKIKDIKANLVRQGDDFDFREGTRAYLDHTVWGPPGDRALIAAYAVARTTTGGAPFVVIYDEDWKRAQKKSASGSKNVGPWVTDTDAMIRKTAVRRLAAFLPQSPVFARGLERDETEPMLDEIIEAEA